MSDQITNWNTLTDEAENILAHEASYVVVHNDKKNSFVVVVKADEMDDASDLAEAKTKANLKAKSIKDSWVASLSPVITIEEKTEQVGNVSL